MKGKTRRAHSQPDMELMVCGTCKAAGSRTGGAPDTRYAQEFGLATVHTNSTGRKPGTVYVTPHSKNCRVLLRAVEGK